MPNYGAKISSAYVSSELLREFVDALPSVMRDIYGNRNLTAYYGWRVTCTRPVVQTDGCFA